jgi:glycerol-3-phosphate acyltransferase PlsY
MQKLLPLILSYILGSIPFGLVLTYLVKKIDIRNFGSGNIGATNVWRVAGPVLGILVFVLDFLKGFISPILVKLFLSYPPNYIFVLAALLSVSGHTWPIFLKFKGGKGVATSLGAITGLSIIFINLRILLILSIFVWILVFSIFRYVSLASISSGFVFFVFSLILSLPVEIKILSFFLFVIILIRHKKNIINLIKGKELSFK